MSADSAQHLNFQAPVQSQPGLLGKTISRREEQGKEGGEKGRRGEERGRERKEGKGGRGVWGSGY